MQKRWDKPAYKRPRSRISFCFGRRPQNWASDSWKRSEPVTPDLITSQPRNHKHTKRSCHVTVPVLFSFPFFLFCSHGGLLLGRLIDSPLSVLQKLSIRNLKVQHCTKCSSKCRKMMLLNIWQLPDGNAQYRIRLQNRSLGIQKVREMSEFRQVNGSEYC